MIKPDGVQRRLLGGASSSGSKQRLRLIGLKLIQ